MINKNIIRKVGVVLLILIVFFSFLFLTSYGYNSQKKKLLKLYSNDENYLTVSGEIIGFNDYTVTIKSTELENYLSEESNQYEFKIFSNDDIELQIGDKIVFTTISKTSKYSSFMPIVEIIKDDKILLDFKIGKQNLIDWVNQLQYK